ncbi:Centromere protein-like protein [Emericellopsis cladophorae]|uniref:CENP-C homolog n=1 Tax=Emericellopsis cladophorae TaxID=2686198 RepID=A0A9P9XWE8_9HYPO|nr:Centromere protein-like protein [Emericellopsis cladophorae]KAI6778803.1 Centromere protein-like protein [Emericellopsis cladophorae]
MAPRGRRAGGEGSESQAFHELGVRGRKTGVALPNTGEVDAQGMQPLDALFSSPTKQPASANGVDDDDENDDESGSEAMSIETSAGPGPRTLLKNQRNDHYPISQDRSPLKTTLRSPARRNPHMSSPIAEDRDVTVTRRINFPSTAKRSKTNGTNGAAAAEMAEQEAATDEHDDDMDMIENGLDAQHEDDGSDGELGEDNLQDAEEVSQAEDEEEAAPETEPQPEPEVEVEPVKQAPAKAARGRGRPKATPAAQVEDQPTPEATQPKSSEKKKRGRPSKKSKEAAVHEAPPAPKTTAERKKRPPLNANSDKDGDQEPPAEESPRAKRQKTTQASPAPAASKLPPKSSTAPKARSRGRPPGRKPKVANAGGDDAGEASLLDLQKGPPMPKRRGLMSVKRDPDAILQTRSGRHTYRPLSWWEGERAIEEDVQQPDIFRKKDQDGFVLKSMKEIVRVHEDEPEPTKRGRGSKSGRKPAAKARAASVKEQDDTEPLEDWETNEGRIVSEVIAWDPEYETQPPGDEEPVDISEEEIAISGEAVQTREIRDATFKFAKTLTMPFMGAGIVDLPPGAVKRPKNSRKMHMVFFVHTGKVSVAVNETEFAISAGGQWFVPRGNYYTIRNEYSQPARIFFAQACELSSTSLQPDMSQSMLMADS